MVEIPWCSSAFNHRGRCEKSDFAGPSNVTIVRSSRSSGSDKIPTSSSTWQAASHGNWSWGGTIFWWAIFGIPSGHPLVMWKHWEKHMDFLAWKMRRKRWNKNWSMTIYPWVYEWHSYEQPPGFTGKPVNHQTAHGSTANCNILPQGQTQTGQSHTLHS